MWDCKFNVIVVPALLCLCTAGIAIASTVQNFINLFNFTHSISHGSDNLPAFLSGNEKTGLLQLTVYCLTLATNISATALIAYKAWRHRCSIKEHLCDGNARTRVEKVLSLLVESGAIYCGFWALSVGSYFLPGGQDAVRSSKPSGDIALGDVICSTAVQISGIYPTIIIILVCIQKTHCDKNFTYSSSSTQFQFRRHSTASTMSTY